MHTKSSRWILAHAVTVGAQDTTVVWVLGQGSSASQPWGPKKNVIQTLLAHS